MRRRRRSHGVTQQQSLSGDPLNITLPCASAEWTRNRQAEQTRRRPSGPGRRAEHVVRQIL
eukprot:scaffold82449_cov64-Phaeocystis_antarctica.AAC.6